VTRKLINCLCAFLVALQIYPMIQFFELKCSAHRPKWWTSLSGRTPGQTRNSSHGGLQLERPPTGNRGLGTCFSGNVNQRLARNSVWWWRKFALARVSIKNGMCVSKKEYSRMHEGIKYANDSEQVILSMQSLTSILQKLEQARPEMSLRRSSILIPITYILW
jgi:hypothetical protein